MARFHVSSDGNPRTCEASKRPCPLGFGPEEHYPTALEARAAYEAAQKPSLFSRMRRSPLKRFALTGGALVATFSLTACGDLRAHPVPSAEGPTPTSMGQVLEGVVKGGAEKAGQLASAEAEHHSGQLSEAEKKARKAAEKAAQYAKGHKGELKQGVAKAGTAVGAASEAGKKALHEVQKAAAEQAATPQGNAGSGLTPPSDVLFQGRPLTVTKAELDGALSKLQQIPVRASNDFVDYDRQRDYGDFAPNTQARIEHRDVPNAVFKSASRNSKAESATYTDPYTGDPAYIKPGDRNDSDLEHIVSLGEASKSANEAWLAHDATARAFREALANDPDNLILVSSSINRAKGDSDVVPHQQKTKSGRTGVQKAFMPSLSACRYSMAIVNVKWKNRQYLAVDPAEKSVLFKTLQEKCVLTSSPG